VSILFFLLGIENIYVYFCNSLYLFVRYGEVVDINLVRDKDTKTSRGFAFVAYEDQKSTVLAVDNFNGVKVRKMREKSEMLPNRPNNCIGSIDSDIDLINCVLYQLCGRTIRVDHCSDYRRRQKKDATEEEKQHQQVRFKMKRLSIKESNFFIQVNVHAI
jgi:RNA recognition motif-containing protein